MAEIQKLILFVDDDLEIISSTRRFLRSTRLDWQVIYAASGSDALLRLQEKKFDVIISDIRMPGMSGIELLEFVRSNYPQAVRIALSGHTDRESSLKISGLAHQFLVKPCPIETIIDAVEQTLKAGRLIADEKLRKLLAQLRSIPSQPQTYLEIVNELKKSEPSFSKVGEVISKDASMSAKILQLVNSPFFGLPQNVINPKQACVMLGLTTIRDLVLTIGVFSEFESGKMRLLKLNNLWDHSQRIGRLAKLIALNLEANARQANDAMVAGLLHDVGRLVLADNFPQQYMEVNQLCKIENKEISAMEQRFFGADHAQVGAYLFGLWGLPGSVQDAIAGHHLPSTSLLRDPLVIAAVHAANVLDYQRMAGQPLIGPPPGFDDKFIRQHGLENKIEAWKQVAATAFSESNLPAP